MHRLAPAFEDVYSERVWVGGSGSGSAPRNTGSYRRFVERFVADHAVGSVVDLGCGDWQSTRLVNFSGADYLGFDVVASLVERNRRLYARPGVRFEVLGDESDLPAADLLVVKDVLQHWPNADVDYLARWLPRYRHVLVTNTVSSTVRRPDGAAIETAPVNSDLPAGGMRPVDVMAAPFGWRGREVHRYASFRSGLGGWETKVTVLITEQRARPAQPAASGAR